MGVDWHTARFLIAARGSGVDFGRTATLGRQNLFVTKNDLGDLLANTAFAETAITIGQIRRNMRMACFGY